MATTITTEQRTALEAFRNCPIAQVRNVGTARMVKSLIKAGLVVETTAAAMRRLDAWHSVKLTAAGAVATGFESIETVAS